MSIVSSLMAGAVSGSSLCPRHPHVFVGWVVTGGLRPFHLSLPGRPRAAVTILGLWSFQEVQSITLSARKGWKRSSLGHF